jgi:hypothetical protein
MRKQNLDRGAFAQALVAALDLYGRQTSAAVLDLYTRAIEHYTTEEAIAALQAHLLDPDAGQYAPRPADIVRRVQGGTLTNAAAAWFKVAKAIRQVGSYRSVAFDDPLIHVAIDELGGWIVLCSLSAEDLKYRGRDFEKLYIGLRQGGRHVDRVLPYLTGRAEAHNGPLGLPVSPPVLIGDKAKALALSTQPAALEAPL